MQIDASAVLRILPHREPLQLIEGVSLSSRGVAGVASFRLNPGVPLMDGTGSDDLRQELVLEAAAQALGVVLGSACVAADGATVLPQQDQKHLLLGFDDVRFTGHAIPLGKSMQIEVSRQQALGDIFCAGFVVFDAQLRIAEGSVMVMKGPA